jgi:putative spermidine/putrescine transport system permease protein
MVAPRYSTDWEALSLRLVFGALAAIAIVFLVGPTVIMLLTSFTASQSLKFPPDGLSLRWYVALLDADQMQAAAWNSLVVAFWTTVLSVVLGTAAALGIARSRSPLARACDVLFMSPLLLPALAFGFAALIFIHRLGFAPSIPFLVLGHTVVCVPFVLRTTIAALSQLDPALLDASQSLGAGGWRTFRRVTLPLIAPGLGAGAFLAFMA